MFAANTTWYLLSLVISFFCSPSIVPTTYTSKSELKWIEEWERKNKKTTKRDTKQRRHTFLHIEIKWNWNCWKDWSTQLKQLLEIEWRFVKFYDDSSNRKKTIHAHIHSFYSTSSFTFSLPPVRVSAIGRSYLIRMNIKKFAFEIVNFD